MLLRFQKPLTSCARVLARLGGLAWNAVMEDRRLSGPRVTQEPAAWTYRLCEPRGWRASTFLQQSAQEVWTCAGCCCRVRDGTSGAWRPVNDCSVRRLPRLPLASHWVTSLINRFPESCPPPPSPTVIVRVWRLHMQGLCVTVLPLARPMCRVSQGSIHANCGVHGCDR